MGDTNNHFIGVDVGGTKIYTGVFNSAMQCVGSARISTKPQRGPDAIIERIARCVKDAVDECDLDLKAVRGVGVGAPGAVDAETGRSSSRPTCPSGKTSR